MKATTLAVSMPYEGCDKDCPYCVSKMTGYMKANKELFFRNLRKAKTLATASQVTDVIITGKGEPMFNEESRNDVLEVCDILNEFPIVLQTNGRFLLKDAHKDGYWIQLLSTVAEMNTVAVSIDNKSLFHLYKRLWEELNENGFTIRVTVNLNNVSVEEPFEWYIEQCKKYGIHQISFREITIPNYRQETEESNKAAEWIKERATKGINEWIAALAVKLANNGRKLRNLPYGAVLYDYEGISVTHFDYCIQDSSENGDDIRSLIYQENGHMYTTWNSEASRIF